MQKTILLTGLWLLCLLCAPTARAQTPTESPPDSLPARQYKWEVATDLLWLLDKNTVPATSVFFRRHTQKGAWRLRVGVDFSHDMVEFLDLPTTLRFGNDNKDSRNFLYFLRVGYQKNKVIRKYNFYYGTDVFFNKARHYADNFITDSNIQLREIINIKEYRGGIAGFLGLQKYFIPNVSISGEVTLNVYYNYLEYKRETDFYPIPQGAGGSFRIDRKFSASFTPLYVFNVSYHF